MTVAFDPLWILAPEFWHRPLDERMADLGALREAEPFTFVEIPAAYTGVDGGGFYAATRFAEILEISRHPELFCSGKGSTTILDMPVDGLEYFGSFINMDDPRHARQRGIVGRSFTPKRLQGVLDSVETICTEVIDGFCERGEADLVEVLSAPFPLLVICDMMGIPRSEFGRVLEATDVILGNGDPEMAPPGIDPWTAISDAGASLTELMHELVAKRRSDPRDDLTSALVHNDLGEEMLRPEEIPPFFILLAVAGNDTTRTALTLGAHLLGRHPDQRDAWAANPAMTGTAVEEIVRYATPVTFMRRVVTTPTELSGQRFNEGDGIILFYGAANRDPRAFENPETFDLTRTPNNHLGFGGPGPHFCLGAHLARRELAVAFRQLFDRLPDLEPTGEPEYLQGISVPLVGGVKRLPVRFTPTKASC